MSLQGEIKWSEFCVFNCGHMSLWVQHEKRVGKYLHALTIHLLILEKNKTMERIQAIGWMGMINIYFEICREILFDVYYLIIDILIDLNQLICRKDAVPKLSYKRHYLMKEIANILELCRSTRYGRYVVGRKKVDVGKIIARAKPYASVVYRVDASQFYCLTCKKLDGELFPCRLCNQVHFCSQKCESENKMHDIECGSDFQKINSGYIKLAIQMVFVAMLKFKSPDSMKMYVDRAFFSRRSRHDWDRTPDDIDALVLREYDVLLSLSGYNRRSDADLVKEMFTIIMEMRQVHYWFDSHKKRALLRNLLQYHLAIIRTYAMEENISNNLREMFIYDSMSLISHSCNPNVMHNRKNGVGYFTTIRPIAMNERVCFNYLGNFSDSKLLRRNRIHRNWGFVCDCSKCLPGRVSANKTKEMAQNYSYRYVRRHMGDELLTKESYRRRRIARECAKFIRKYGHIWTPQLENIVEVYTFALREKGFETGAGN